jgi:hypothetical protein
MLSQSLAIYNLLITGANVCSMDITLFNHDIYRVKGTKYHASFTPYARSSSRVVGNRLTWLLK